MGLVQIGYNDAPLHLYPNSNFVLHNLNEVSVAYCSNRKMKKIYG